MNFCRLIQKLQLITKTLLIYRNCQQLKTSLRQKTWSSQINSKTHNIVKTDEEQMMKPINDKKFKMNKNSLNGNGYLYQKLSQK